MALFGLMRDPTVTDPVLGVLAFSRGYWRGRLALGACPDVPLLRAGGRQGPNSAALALARELPSRYPSMQGLIGEALFEHHLPYWQEIDARDAERKVQLRSAAEVWPHVTLAHVIIDPLNPLFTLEIGYATVWDIEHILGARLSDWQLVELNGSVRRVRS
jgi:hypothetical protein